MEVHLASDSSYWCKEITNALGCTLSLSFDLISLISVMKTSGLEYIYFLSALRVH